MDHANPSLPPQDFPPLAARAAVEPRPRLRICIVSHELVGPSNNGGIGTAYTAMADTLAEAGHDVTCLYAKGMECAAQDLAYWQKQYRARNVTLVPLPRSTGHIDALGYSVTSYEVYQWLKAHDAFDFVHFPEWQGLGYHTQMARRQGLAFARTRICIGLHSMTEWIRASNRLYLNDPNDLQLEHMERQSVALADILISPSQYLLRWIQERGWLLPPVCHVQQNIMPRTASAAAGPAATGAGKITELVFFGRLETRKGVQVFCDALDRLSAAPTGGIERVTFLGKEAVVEGVLGEAFVRRRAQQWPWPVQVLKDRNQPQAMEYLRGDGRLAIIPSLMENSPYTVLECLGVGVAFIASRVGGIPELIAEDDRPAACFEPTPQALADRLQTILTRGHRRAGCAIDAETNKRTWVAWHEQQAAEIRALPRPAAPATWPRVSVCLTTVNRPRLLRQALESVRLLTYPNFEVILVDDGSTQPDAVAFLDQLEPDFARRGWRIVRQSNRYLGAARNTAARHAAGEFLLFMDDDNYAEPHELTVFVQAMLGSGADILSCGMNYFSGQNAPDRKGPAGGRWLPLGAAASAGVFANCFGDANALVRRSCFEALGGFTEDYGITHEDWEFHAKAVLKGFKLQVVPEFLFWYRVNSDSMLRTLAPYPNYMRSIRPYVDAVPRELRDLMLYAHGAATQLTTTGTSPGWDSYLKPTIQWRSKLEAGLVLMELGQNAAAAKTMLAGIKAVETCKQPRIILEALLEICTHLGRLDPGRTRFLLGIAINAAKNYRRTEELERAEKLLAALPPAGQPAAA